jgi:ABC-2 type transport system permease protein
VTRNLAKLAAFVKRDFLSEISYRVSFAFQVLGMFVSLLAFYFLTGMIDPRTEGLDGIRPFDYLLMGVAFQFYFSTALNAFARKIRNEQMMGTLEAMLVTPTPTAIVVFCSASWPFVFGGIRILVYLFFATAVFGVRLHTGALDLVLVGFLLTLLSSMALGVLSASFVLYFKRGDPINWLMSGLTTFLGTVFFPVEQIPIEMVRPIADYVPIALSLKIIRGSLLQGQGWSELAGVALRLLVISALLIPGAVLLSRLAIRKAKQEGTLVQY